MQKRVFYAILGVSIAVAAASIGYSASRILDVRHFALRPSVAARVPAGELSRTAQIPPEKLTNIFAPDQGMEIPSKLAGTGKSAELSNTKYVLLGTIVSESRSARRAILWTEGMKNSKMVREKGEIEPGLILNRIERDYVMLARGKALEKLDILPVGSKTRTIAPPAPPVTAADRTAALPAGEIKTTRLGDNAYSLDESTVSQLTSNINQYMSNVRLIPFFEGNKSAGYRIASIRPGTAFEQLGFKGGDVIQQVNDVELSSPEKMYTIFQNLKDEKRVTVNILRQGQKSTITYEIR